MAGIYIHIPFCKQACNYCNFHFSTSLHYKDDVVAAISKEIITRKDFLEDKTISSIYFGGGSPSLLTGDDLKEILDTIFNHYNTSSLKEVTLEANPDDLTTEKIKAIQSSAVNRFSIGIQSFFDDDLQWMNRAHNAQQADRAVKTAQDAGFENITIDLIYGIPTLTNEKWKQNLHTALQLNVPHISSYSLTVEEKTPLHKLIQIGKKENVDEEKSAYQMQMLMDTLQQNGFEHYEISNFAKPNFYAFHNSNYWKAEWYLGIGPSAHSFKKNRRSWNVSNNLKYIQAINNKEQYSEEEILTDIDLFNEWLMTGLRTQWGCNIKDGYINFEKKWIDNMLAFDAQPYFQSNQLINDNSVLKLTPSGKLIADKIISDLFQVNK